MSLSILPLEGVGEVTAGERLSDLLPGDHLRDGDVVVVTSKVVSKAEGRVVDCAKGDPTAREDLIRSESVRVLRRRGPLVITETKHGFICANAGIDWSNVGSGKAVLLPVDPDNSAHRLRNGLRVRFDVDVAVVVSDTFGRVWRNGVTDVAIGCAGLRPMIDLRGTVDGHGNELSVTQVCVADQLASAAEMVMGKASGIPAAIVRGVDPTWFGEGSIRRDVLRRPVDDLFR